MSKPCKIQEGALRGLKMRHSHKNIYTSCPLHTLSSLSAIFPSLSLSNSACAPIMSAILFNHSKTNNVILLSVNIFATPPHCQVTFFFFSLQKDKMYLGEIRNGPLVRKHCFCSHDYVPLVLPSLLESYFATVLGVLKM